MSIKQCFLIAFVMMIFINSFSQITTTGRIDSVKDSWKENTTYIGEIKNGKPNGLGMAIYDNTVVLRYAGNFVNGNYEGKGVLLYTNGYFLSGDWKAGKLNGQGTFTNFEKDLYVGNFVDGGKSGAGTMIYGGNGFLQGNFKNDVYEGRCIYMVNTGDLICDNIYVDGKKTGPGFQYDVKDKKLYEGIFKNDEWVEATTNNYSSFLKNASFYAEKTADDILMGGINKNNENLLEDTAFYYDLKAKKRYYGFYHNGVQQSGIIIKDDTSRFIGNTNEDGAYGKGYYLKLGKYYDEGNYVKDYLSGDNSLSIDLEKKTIYYGQTNGNASFTGKAWFANDYNELFNGDYVDGDFTGNGWRIDKSGYCLKGIWKNGMIKSVDALYNARGELINTKPKTFTEWLSSICKAFPENFYGLGDKNNSSEKYDWLLNNASESYIDYTGTSSKDIVATDDDKNSFYVATFTETSNFDEAKKAYEDLCNQTKTTTITLKKGAAPLALSGDIIEVDDMDYVTISQFVLPASAKGFSDFALSVIILKDYLDEYTVSLAFGNKEAVQNWTGE